MGETFVPGEATSNGHQVWMDPNVTGGAGMMGGGLMGMPMGPMGAAGTTIDGQMSFAPMNSQMGMVPGMEGQWGDGNSTQYWDRLVDGESWRGGVESGVSERADGD